MSETSFRSQLIQPSDRLISALDNMSWEEASAQVAETGSSVGMGKTNSLHTRKGADYAVAVMTENGLYLMLDSKFHDIPETVQGHIREATLAGASLITVHASGGVNMLRGAMAGREEARKQIQEAKPRDDIQRIGGVLGITVLTSLDEDDCESIFGIPKEDKDGIKKKVVQFADMAVDAGLDGIVCSGLELDAIRSRSRFDGLLLVIPGITPPFATKAGDQKRTVTPKEAMERGADLIVVGRAINQAEKYGLTKLQAAQHTVENLAEGIAA